MEQFQEYRPLLFSIAYRMTGSASQAEDIVQDAYLHYQQVDTASIQSSKAYLTKMVTNLSLNYLKSARVQREEYIGIWLPEPMLTLLATGESLEMNIEQQESVSTAFLVLLETLTPPERAVFLLHEVFDYSFAEIAEILEKSPANCRQLFHRAKSHVTEKRQRVNIEPEKQHQLMESFVSACQSGNLDALTKLLARDVTAWSDGGGKVHAGLIPVAGQAMVARLFLNLMRKVPFDDLLSIEEVNGAPALVCWSASQLQWVLILDILDDAIVGLYSILNPDKLVFLQHQLELQQEKSG
ncbi:DNA-directed RNA polymerase sigma-70 factor [Dictyobacter alpinus]|uniref:DNA-directed RNA polymerase sigma-70 factor n=1 Tax=Dictyobacter alpinus TaxID=2014873 RepID=A0A402BGE5_9CHLR|nr:RNA polymerase sigma-70 factor [Dictyobacter alpinus]GCE30433.1 DNA-directed RNA polymerase sigma-70 factor [Dictyobacter alpinus]